MSCFSKSLPNDCFEEKLMEIFRRSWDADQDEEAGVVSL